MKLDVTCMRYLTKEDYRVLEAVELGMRNHELVPVPLITSIAKLRHGGLHKFLSTLLRYKLLAHANHDYNGYRLSYMGYDILALHTLLMRGTISGVGSQIGVGKESDIFEAQDEHGNDIVLKIHRLGRTSFRSVRRNRDYMTGKSKASWLYMSRLAAIKEFAFMRALYEHGFPTPVPFDQSRHIVAMSRVQGFPMAQVKSGKMYGEIPENLFKICLALLRRLAEHGLVHCDFNEFNLMVDDQCHVTLIDFPQMVSTSHANAAELFDRDIHGLVKFFAMKMRYVPDDSLLIGLADITECTTHLDEEVRASGFTDKDDEALVEFIMAQRCREDIDGEKQGSDDDDDDGDDDNDDGDDDDNEEAANADRDSVSAVESVDGVDDSGTLVSATVEIKTSDVKRSAVPEVTHGGASVFTFDTLSTRSQKGILETHLLPQSRVVQGDEGVAAATKDASDDELDELSNQPSRAVLDKVKERVRRDMRASSAKQSSRNSTKKRNKYGKIDRVDKSDW
jgi:RIO kinase 2